MYCNRQYQCYEADLHNLKVHWGEVVNYRSDLGHGLIFTVSELH